ncbi:MAG TPA: ATP-binding protein [Thermoanaerobaculia bacterium]|jgi:PAS domain S-box-containing protein|nr:ATP-binding protein [Thermoanaerobaculia bacterium]
MTEISPEVQESADRVTARRALVGVASYPLVVAVLGLAAGLPERNPYLFTVLMSSILALAGVRLVLVWRFDPIHRVRPRLWRAAFYSALILNALVLGGTFFAAVRSYGPRLESFFVFTVAAVIASMAVILYSHALRVVVLFVVVLMAPVLLTFSRMEGPAAWHPSSWEYVCLVVFFGYLFLLAVQLHRERWEALHGAHLLAIRAAELERARNELDRVRDELERLVDERTQELRKVSEDYRRIFENAHDPILIFRPADEVVLNVNRRACEIYGFSREELVGMSLMDVSENVPRGRDQVAQTMEKGVFYNFESVQFRKDGSRMFLEINASLIEYEGQVAILSINRDVTERRKAGELRLAKEAAEQADQAKSRFLANMSHEIRTPMAGVLGLVDLLLKTELSPTQRGYGDLIQTSAGSLLRLIDDVLDFSKIEAGRLSLERVPFDLHATLREIVELLRFRASARRTDLALVLRSGVPEWVWGDPGRLRQVLTNLVGNAVKFTEGGRVDVEAERQVDGRLRFMISDTGIGIPQEVRGRLFTLFSQADSSTSRRFGGSGLGLAISQRIVEQMNGEIGYESTPDVGSVFWFILPFEPAAPPVAVPSPPSGAVLARSDGRQYRILVAEDNAINQLVITHELAALGYEVVAVNNGLEALEALEDDAFDLVLMDCQMPELDGYEASRRIRASPGETGRIPIVALTAHALKEDLERCIDAGMNDTITKPFREDVLRQKLERWLGVKTEA